MDTDRRIAGLAGTQGGLVARRQLAALGVGRGAIERRLAARRLHPVPGHRGVFAVGHTARGRRTALWAAHLALGPSSVISHRSAAALWELRRTAAARVELTVTGPSKRRSAIQVHRTTSLPARHVTTVDGLPTTTVPRTLVDLAALLPERSVETAVDRADALRLLDMADLLQTLRENPRRPGARRMRIVIGRQRIGMTLTDTDLEEMVLALVRAAGLPDPVTQHPILTYRADLCWPEARLVVEADGDRWHRTRGARQHDRRRDVALANAGWTVLRFTDADIVLDPGTSSRRSGPLWPGSRRPRLRPVPADELPGVAPMLDLGFARLDTGRQARQGVPEAVLAEGKTPAQVAEIARRMVSDGTDTVLVTRADDVTRAAVLAAVPEMLEDPEARLVWLPRAVPDPVGTVTVVSAGTSDRPVVREVVVCAELLGTTVVVQEDVGVAGLHRLAVAMDDLRAADCVVVVAGQDAALASVVGGLVAAPVIACPTSVGYGVAKGGQVALMAMLASCAPGVAVVDIDDGFGAATVASRIARGRA